MLTPDRCELLQDVCSQGTSSKLPIGYANLRQWWVPGSATGATSVFTSEDD